MNRFLFSVLLASVASTSTPVWAQDEGDDEDQISEFPVTSAMADYLINKYPCDGEKSIEELKKALNVSKIKKPLKNVSRFLGGGVDFNGLKSQLSEYLKACQDALDEGGDEGDGGDF